MATEYSVRLRRNYEHPRGCLCCSLSDSRRDLSITCSTEASIECRIRKCVRQRLGWLAKATEFPERKRYSGWLWFRCSRLFLFFRTRPNRNSGCGTTASSQGDLHAQACLSTGVGETGAHRERGCIAYDRSTNRQSYRSAMLQSTGNKQLDGAALEAYSQWRFQPGTGSQVKIPIEFASRPKPPPPKRTAPQPAILYPLLILLGFGVAVIAMRTRRRSAR